MKKFRKLQMDLKMVGIMIEKIGHTYELWKKSDDIWICDSMAEVNEAISHLKAV